MVSDDAGQFDIGQHALCWIHAERLMHKLDTFADAQRATQQHVRGLIWWFYADLKAYRLDPTPRRRCELRTRFGRIFRRHTGFATLDRLLPRLHANKAELLMVLDHPVDTLRGSTPLHTNGSENDIRCQVTKRHVSGGTHTTTGRDCRDAFLGLAKTCRKARRRILGLPRRSARRSRRPNRPTPARSYPLSRGASRKPRSPGVLPRLRP